jgi:chemotaxis protein CheZ
MPSEGLDPALLSEIKMLKSGRVREAAPEEIVSVVRAVIDGMNRNIPTIDVSVRDNVEDLATYIRETKAEIMTLKPEEIADEHVPAATVELDAIVNATEEATHSIMEAAENIESVAGSIDAALADTLINATTQIYEACGFQDITGQRIGKVVRALQEIEAKVDALVAAFGDEDEAQRQERQERRRRRREQERDEAVQAGDVREGPQLPSSAVSQNDIDALFASLG